MFMQRRSNLTSAKSRCISFLDVFPAVPPFHSHAWLAKAAERLEYLHNIQIMNVYKLWVKLGISLNLFWIA
jgi:hypothetical protein